MMNIDEYACYDIHKGMSHIVCCGSLVVSAPVTDTKVIAKLRSYGWIVDDNINNYATTYTGTDMFIVTVRDKPLFILEKKESVINETDT